VEQKAAMVLEYSDYGYVLEMGNNLHHYFSLCKREVRRDFRKIIFYLRISETSILHQGLKRS
jgi:ABC-type branched-subunit amino acid transport system ATPase component